MTKDDWAALEIELQNPWGNAALMVDGFKVSFQVAQDKMKLFIIVYVNGWMRGEWLSKKTEEATRFCRPVTFRLFPPSQVKKLTSGLSTARVKKLFPDLDLEKKGVYYTSHWLSFSALKRHLIANNKSIELVKAAELEGIA